MSSSTYVRMTKLSTQLSSYIHTLLMVTTWFVLAELLADSDEPNICNLYSIYLAVPVGQKRAWRSWANLRSLDKETSV